MKNKVFSGIDKLPSGFASDNVIQGCVVLEGGGFRGVYTSGVLDALMEADINMSCTIGVSAGALNGVNYVAGQIGRSAKANLTYRHDSRYVGLKALRQSGGIIGIDFLFEDFNNIMPLNTKRFFSPERTFIAVATNCLTGKPQYFDNHTHNESIFKAVKASSSLPYISKMVYINDVPYLDGGCSDKIPYRWAIENGYEKIVVIKTRPDGYRKKVSKKDNHSFTKLCYGTYPNFVEAFSKSDKNYNRQCDEIDALRKQGKVYVITPSKTVTVGRVEGDMGKLGQLYYMGYKDGKNQTQNIKKYLSESIKETNQ